MVYPVYHVVCGENHQRLYIAVIIDGIVFRLLGVVRAVYIQSAIVFDCGGVCAEYIRRNGIGVTLVFVDISTYLVDYYSVVKAVDYFRFTHTVYAVYAVGRAFRLRR